MRTLLVLLTAALVAPVAAAGPQPALLFLDDDGSPVAPGSLSSEYPQANESKVRFVLPAIDGPNAWFIANATSADRLYGPLFIGLWTDSSIVLEGNLSASLYLRVDGVDELIASGSQSVALDPDEVPDPTSLVPPDPTDPVGSALFIASQVMPLLLQPPMLFDLGMVDIEIPANATLVLGLGLVAPDSGELPSGAGIASIKYAGKLSPSFVYAPWYVVDPEAPPVAGPSPSPSPTSSASPSPSPTVDVEDPGSDDKGAPGFAVVTLMAGLLGAALLARRRV